MLNTYGLKMDKPLTLERVAKEYLEIYDNDCGGDSYSGIDPCPFFQIPDINKDGTQLVGGCELNAYLRAKGS